jgi:hypothetical protein
MPEAELSRRLAALSADVVGSALLAPAADVRKRGDRRRTHILAYSAVAAGVLTASAGVAVAAGIGGGNSTLPIGAIATTIPDQLVMPHQDESGWQRDDNPQIVSVFEPCDAGDVTQPGRTDARTLTGHGNPIEEEHSPTVITNQLFLYGSQQDAEAVLAALARDVGRCGWNGGMVTDTVYGEHVLMARSSLIGDAPLHDVMVIRRGNVIYQSYSVISGAMMSSGDYPAVEEMGRRLCAVLGLCEPVWCYESQPSPSPPAKVPCPSGFGSPEWATPPDYPGIPSGSVGPSVILTSFPPSYDPGPTVEPTPGPSLSASPTG